MSTYDDEPAGAGSSGAPTEAAAAARLALSAATPKTLDPLKPQAVVVPDGATLIIPDLSAWRDGPDRKTGVYRPATVDSLLDYLANHYENWSTIWVHPTSGQVTAVIDDNGGLEGDPGYGEHRAELALAHTPEWEYWIEKDKQMCGQEAFAEHIEGGLQQIEQPDAADVLEMAQSFHATNNVTFQQSTRLSTGEQQLQYAEEVTASAGRTGQLQVPTTIVLVLSPFLGEPEVQITARFRFRVATGKLTLGYLIDQPDKIVRDQLETVAERIKAKFANTYLGEGPLR